ncbi:hypothetical protein KI387_034685 [Taxus chinensis]|uniref:Uncharacterized protein n=1 Tax=Taxus chinensis TaxID=29808 RepID=A0AA38C5Y7_TAXCH|nr:hypothetical protein KI387_034685 [Taxus chinensis]
MPRARARKRHQKRNTKNINVTCLQPEEGTFADVTSLKAVIEQVQRELPRKLPSSVRDFPCGCGRFANDLDQPLVRYIEELVAWKEQPQDYEEEETEPDCPSQEISGGHELPLAGTEQGLQK